MSLHELDVLRRRAQEDHSLMPSYVRALERAVGLEPKTKLRSLEDFKPGPILEEKNQDILDTWRDFASVAKPGEVDKFIDLLAEYSHDYGTICVAMACAAKAAANALNETPQGGITGFQAGAVMWEFVKMWTGLDGPARLLDFSYMLYPQEEDRFELVLSPAAWDWLQQRAAHLLEEGLGSPRVKEHWQTIVDGKVPFGWRVRDDDDE